MTDLTTKDMKNHEKNRFTAETQRAQREAVVKNEKK
jgi:hypothetical protein